ENGEHPGARQSQPRGVLWFHLDQIATLCSVLISLIDNQFRLPPLDRLDAEASILECSQDTENRPIPLLENLHDARGIGGTLFRFCGKSLGQNPVADAGGWAVARR